MARHPNPVRPRLKDEREYERRLRRRILDPLFRSLRSGLAEVAGLAQAFAIIARREAPDLGSIPETEAREHFERVEDYHRKRVIQTFRAALGVRVAPLLDAGPVHAALEARIAENVRLIKTIPQATPVSLRARLMRTFRDAPFDQQALRKVFSEEFRASGYNLRRLTRDQTTKAIGQLTGIRHRQIGIEEYIWRTSQDERWFCPPGMAHF